ncbi:hypothetical protein BHF71_02805 [Vulcanibacillus modesticaldus]|uniref:Glycosyl transferase family 1 domain-containing protein n=1 Tax=Vulcanibacillus modesticaldus TaxID=337097 RepID=A0A1D2YT48_9BACI|nr:glycosyltransferase family 4 protein [Vulcanibacillus modesticaldus]OEF98874.1 hypothetical protein BHF71_02805 [Vulcanibacillus modesticaldus]
MKRKSNRKVLGDLRKMNIQNIKENYQRILLEPFPVETRKIVELVKNKNYKAIVIYPADRKSGPHERQLNILRQFASKKYLCFYCEISSGRDLIKELEKNLFIINNDLYLLPFIRSKYVITMVSHSTQMIFADLLPNKLVWYDVFNRKYLLLKENLKILKYADIVSYANQQFKKYVRLGENAIFLPQEKSEIVGIFEKRINNNYLWWKIYANINPADEIAVMTSTFFDFNGEDFYSGGAERYLVDLAELFSKKNLILNVYQKGNFPWVRRYKDIDVISLFIDNPQQIGFNRSFYEQIEGRTLLNIYSAYFEAYPQVAHPNIGISHGVAWDNPINYFSSGNKFWETNLRFIESAKLCDQLVSVDTNTANWFQTINYEISRNIKVIPNYVDLKQFTPRKNYDKKSEKIVIIYPRRLYKPRGFYLVLEILDDILVNYSNVEFHFVGKGLNSDTKHLLKKREKWGDRIKWYTLPPKKMAMAYQNSDIALIPTINSEGTSLSCLEAMACGNAVIATRVGGLTDLIIDQYNGLLIDPKPQALKEGIIDLLENKEKLIDFKKRSVEVAKAFSKENWIKKWEKLIDHHLKGGFSKKQKGRLVEVYLEKLPPNILGLGKLINTLLSRGDLIYIYVKNFELSKNLSFGRIQWLDWNTEKYSIPDFIIADEMIAKEINSKIDLTINSTWLKKFTHSPQKYYPQLGIKTKISRS